MKAKRNKQKQKPGENNKKKIIISFRCENHNNYFPFFLLLSVFIFFSALRDDHIKGR